MAYSSPFACKIKCAVTAGVFVCLWLFSTLQGVVAKAGNDASYPEPVASFSTPNPQIQYDVFVSFRGPDIRQRFLSHLIDSLKRKEINYFTDVRLEQGDEISQALLGAIEQSSISIAIFSQNYAASRWCLEELVKMVECRKKNGQIVLPVFYNVAPSDVRYQKGTYENAFAKHTKRYGLTAVQTWKSALSESANLSGFDSSNFRNDSELVEEIVKRVWMMLNHTHQVYSEGLVGIAKPIAHLESLLHLESEEVRIIGIWGMGGIGKTTIAEKVFNRLRYDYDGCCFLANVREKSGRDGIASLKKKLFSELLREEDLKIDTPNELPIYVHKRLHHKKFLVVLDDVSESKQLENLVGAPTWFGSGSRIIVTSRNRQVLVREDVVIYEVEALNFNESLQLFNFHAFGKNHSANKEYHEKSKRVVSSAKGVPLVLEQLGRSVKGKDEETWESILNKPNQEVYRAIKLSYDDLDRNEKKIFLDIACFFDGLNLKVDDIKLFLKDRDYSVAAELEKLKDIAFITISQDNIVSMPDIIQEIAWEIVQDKSTDGDPGKQSRLMDPDDIYDVLKENKGSEAIRSITINLSLMKKLQLNPQVFSKMSKLKFLDFYSSGSYSFLEDQGGLYLPQGLESLPNELRYLRWAYYPLESLPTQFLAENLVLLCLPNSRVKKLWDGDQNLMNLEALLLRSSTNLMQLPNLSKAANLKVIDLRFCTGLTHVNSSVFSLSKLERLDLGGCVSLKSLQSNIQLSSLRYLSLFGCTSLEEFSVTSKKMKILNLESTGIKQLPSSIGLQSKLEMLSLGYTYIEHLPTSVKNLTRLRVLDLQNCGELHTLPLLPPSLEILDARDCISLKNVLFPPTIEEQLKENRTRVAFWNCLNLDQHSLKSIRLNAQVNMMKFASQHLSTLGRDYPAQAMYVYPGNKVPEWFIYKTTNDYLTIDASSDPYYHQLRYIFCFIVPKIPSEGLILKFQIRDDEDEENNINVDLDRPLDEIASEHVYLMYDVRISHYLNSRVKEQKRPKIKVKAVSLTMDSQYVPLLLRGFGVHPINTSQYHGFIQQMESSDIAPSTRVIFNKWKWVMQLERNYVFSLLMAILLSLVSYCCCRN